MAGTLRAEANLAASNALFLVLLFLGGMAYPLDKLPGALEAIAKLLPAAALSETVRAVLTAEAFPIGEFVVLVVWAVAAPLLAAALLPLGRVTYGASGRHGEQGGRAVRRAHASCRDAVHAVATTPSASMNHVCGMPLTP